MQSVTQAERQREFLSWKFGLFLHFGMSTFTGYDWSSGYEDPALFRPARLDCGQWADAAAAAGMKYMVLTVKHTGGWCLWPSRLTRHGVQQFVNFRNGSGDIVREFIEACRSRKLKAGFYYCSPGAYGGVPYAHPRPPGTPMLHGMPPEARDRMPDFMHEQLRELLTWYGEIDLFWSDQWEASWPRHLALIRALQPNCLVVANNAEDLENSDVHSVEYNISANQARLPGPGNTIPFEISDTIVNSWFWNINREMRPKRTPREIAVLLSLCSSRNANLLFNVPPNPDGLISEPFQEYLREVGRLRG